MCLLLTLFTESCSESNLSKSLRSCKNVECSIEFILEDGRWFEKLSVNKWVVIIMLP